MKTTLQLLLVGACTLALTNSAHAGLPPDWEPPEEPEPEPEPPPPPTGPQSFFYAAQSNASIGNSTLGASYQASLQVSADAARQNFSARGYASAQATLLGLKKNLAIVNGYITAGTSFGTEISTYVLGQHVFSYKDSFNTSFSKSFSAIDWRNNLWQYSNSWSWFGSGVTIRLALDGGVNMSGTASASPLRVSGGLNPRVWADAGGTLSLQFLWITAGSITGTVRLLDAQASGTATIDGTALPFGGKMTWSVSGWAKLCSLGGSISGCALGRCGTLVSWNAVCPGWLSISGAASGQI
jgi:hypothetical protein